MGSDVKRYGQDRYGDLVERAAGAFVLHADHLAALAKVTAERDATIAGLEARLADAIEAKQRQGLTLMGQAMRAGNERNAVTRRAEAAEARAGALHRELTRIERLIHLSGLSPKAWDLDNVTRTLANNGDEHG